MLVEQWLGKDNTLGIDIWNRKYRKGEETFDQWLDREKPPKCLFSVYQGFLTCLRTALGNPWQFLFQLMINILVKIVGSNKTFLFFVKYATLIHLIQTEIVGDILVIQKSSHTDRTNDFGFLSFSWGYLRFERL